jgi:hypothetical protein
MTQVSALGGPADLRAVARALAPALVSELRLAEGTAAEAALRAFDSE